MAKTRGNLPKCGVCGKTATHGAAVFYKRDNWTLGIVERKQIDWLNGCNEHPVDVVEIDLGDSINGAVPWPED